MFSSFMALNLSNYGKKKMEILLYGIVIKLEMLCIKYNIYIYTYNLRTPYTYYQQ